MKTPLKVAGWLLLAVVVAVVAATTYVSFLLPNVGEAPNLKVDVTPERIQRGEYLANHVVICMDCHSQRDFSKFSGPLVDGTLGMGGEKFAEEFGFPGTFYAKNITPHGLADWTDGEIYRTITTGVTKDGKAIFPVMPYKYYGQMDPEDVKDIIAYLRSIEPVENVIPESKANFPFNFILNTIPSKVEPVQKPSPTDQVAYGSYLAHIAACVECHTPPDDKGQKLPGMQLAGGWEMGVGGGKFVTTANITPDKETGIGNWTESDFIHRFKTYTDSGYVAPSVTPGEFQTTMPWIMFSKMKEEDLKAIYAYLRTVPAVNHPITKFK